MMAFLARADYDFREIQQEEVENQIVTHEEIKIESVKTDKIEAIDLEVITDEQRDWLNFEKYYNNNYVFITFR